MMPAVSEGSGTKAWRTRRRGLYLSAIHSLVRLAEDQDLPRLVLAFGTITDFLSPALMVGMPCAPYELVLNGADELSFSFFGSLLNPAFMDPFPSLEAAAQFAADLRGPWFDELAQSAGLSSRTVFLEVGGR